MIISHRRLFVVFLILSSILAAFLLYEFVLYKIYPIRVVSIREINLNPESFNGFHVELHGYIVDTSVYMFGPKYVLRDFDYGVEIALGGKGGPKNVDLAPYVSFVFDGRNYTQIGNKIVSVVGYVRYIGWVTDFSSFLLDVEGVEQQT